MRCHISRTGLPNAFEHCGRLDGGVVEQLAAERAAALDDVELHRGRRHAELVAISSAAAIGVFRRAQISALSLRDVGDRAVRLQGAVAAEEEGEVARRRSWRAGQPGHRERHLGGPQRLEHGRVRLAGDGAGAPA